MGCEETRNDYKACREVSYLFQPSFPHWMVLGLCPSLTFLCYIRNKHFPLTFDGKNRAWTAPERLVWGCRSTYPLKLLSIPRSWKQTFNVALHLPKLESFCLCPTWSLSWFGFQLRMVELVLKHRGLWLCLGSERSCIRIYEKTYLYET